MGRPNPSDLEALTQGVVDAVNTPGVLVSPGAAQTGFMPVSDVDSLGSGTFVRVLPIGLDDAGESTRDHAFDEIRFGISIAQNVKATDTATLWPLIMQSNRLREHLRYGPLPTAPNQISPPWTIGDLSVSSVTFGGGTGDIFYRDVLITHDVYLSDLELSLNYA